MNNNRYKFTVTVNNEMNNKTNILFLPHSTNLIPNTIMKIQKLLAQENTNTLIIFIIRVKVSVVVIGFSSPLLAVLYLS